MSVCFPDVADYPEVLVITSGRKFGWGFETAADDVGPADSLSGYQSAEMRFWRGSGASLRQHVLTLQNGGVEFQGNVFACFLSPADTAAMASNNGHGTWFWQASIGLDATPSEAIAQGSADLRFVPHD